MRPVGNEDSMPGQGVFVITDGLSKGKMMPESQAGHAILGALHQSFVLHLLPVLTKRNIFTWIQLNKNESCQHHQELV